MKTILLIGCLIFASTIVFSQTTYTFNGNGNWSVASNWSGNVIPPSILPAGSTININPVPGGSCILNVAQTVSPGANFNILLNANFIISGSLTGGPGYPGVTIVIRYGWLKSKYRQIQKW